MNRDKKSLEPVDWLALAVFVLGAFGLVLMGISAFSTDVASQGGTAGVAAAWIAAVGLVPSLLFNGALAFLGARTFLRSNARDLVRDLVGSVVVALGASVACGVFAAGGAVGAATGQALAQKVGVLLAAVTGAVAVIVPAWIVWLRQLALRPEPVVAPDRTSVSSAETSALSGAETLSDLDDLLEPVEVKPIVATPAPAPATAAAVKVNAPSVYPEDPRSRGEIPTGAKPLIVSGGKAVAYEETQALMGAFEYEPPAPVEAEPTPEELAAYEAELAALEIDETPRPYTPPTPAWETTGLAPDEERVDAYGTPISLVEKVRAEVAEEPLEAVAEAEQATLAADALADEDDDYDALEAELATTVAAAEDAETTVELAEVAPVDDEDLEAEEAGWDEEESEEFAPDEDETDASDLEDDELAMEEDAAVVEAVAEDMVAEEVAAEEAAADEVEAVVAEVEPEPAAAPAEPEPIVAVDAADEPRRAAKRKAKPADDAPSLFDAVQAVAAVPQTEQQPEPQKELVPQAAAPGKSVKHPALLDGERRRVLIEAGCLFVDRGRVAVSMLQKEYGMDFDAACVVLDDLQELGLIGPYLGGQRRDILLTRDQWMERLASA